jgi:hypothetical protein
VWVPACVALPETVWLLVRACERRVGEPDGLAVETCEVVAVGVRLAVAACEAVADAAWLLLGVGDGVVAPLVDWVCEGEATWLLVREGVCAWLLDSVALDERDDVGNELAVALWESVAAELEVSVCELDSC